MSDLRLISGDQAAPLIATIADVRQRATLRAILVELSCDDLDRELAGYADAVKLRSPERIGAAITRVARVMRVLGATACTTPDPTPPEAA